MLPDVDSWKVSVKDLHLYADMIFGFVSLLSRQVISYLLKKKEK